MIAPPIALRPYSAPCGPFSTSMLSMSNSSWLNCDGFAISTPSIITATDGSLLRAWEMPRTMMNEVPWFCVCTIVMLGVSAMKSCGRWMPADWISSGVEGVDRDRHVQQRLVALARRDDDLLHLRALRHGRQRNRGGEDRGHRRRKARSLGCEHESLRVKSSIAT